MALSKSRRFEVFKRDGFTCQYCGRRPDDGETILEVDHIHPRAAGGTDDELNLITSCPACNSGKRAKLLAEVAPKPDADIRTLEVQQETAEAQRFLVARDAWDSTYVHLMRAFDQEVMQAFDWNASFREGPRLWKSLLQLYSPEEIHRAIWITGDAYQRDTFRNKPFDSTIRYMRGVLRNNHEATT